MEKPCDFPADFNVNDYYLFEGNPSRVLKDNDIIDLGDRKLHVLHTPGHSPGHMCFFEEATGYLFTGDLIYLGELFAFFPSTDPLAYMKSIKRLLPLPMKRILPAHHSLDVPLSIISDMDKAFTDLYDVGKLKHGSGVFTYGNFGIHL
jgi:glyoxylase-like metal-dependent hydrolase (beta-lactamase superfamily II)